MLGPMLDPRLALRPMEGGPVLPRLGSGARFGTKTVFSNRRQCCIRNVVARTDRSDHDLRDVVEHRSTSERGRRLDPYESDIGGRLGPSRFRR
jgi:hypothetical protein